MNFLETYIDGQKTVFLPRKIVSVENLKIKVMDNYVSDILIQNEVAKMNSLIEYKKIR